MSLRTFGISVRKLIDSVILAWPIQLVWIYHHALIHCAYLKPLFVWMSFQSDCAVLVLSPACSEILPTPNYNYWSLTTNWILLFFWDSQLRYLISIILILTEIWILTHLRLARTVHLLNYDVFWLLLVLLRFLGQDLIWLLWFLRRWGHATEDLFRVVSGHKFPLLLLNLNRLWRLNDWLDLGFDYLILFIIQFLNWVNALSLLKCWLWRINLSGW